MMDDTVIIIHHNNRIDMIYWVGIGVAVATFKVVGTNYVWLLSYKGIIASMMHALTL